MNNLADKYRDPLGDFRTLVARLGVNVWHQFREHNCMQQASALAFNTLLCLVPLSAVALFLLKTFGAFEDGNSPLIAALNNFLPRYGAEEIVSELSAFANRNLGGSVSVGFCCSSSSQRCCSCLSSNILMPSGVRGGGCR